MTRIAAGLLLGAVCALAAAAQELETGRVEVYAFSAEGRALGGLEVWVGPLRLHTRRDGSARAELPPGIHELSVLHRGAVLGREQVPVVAGEVSEVLVRITPQGRAEVDVEGAGWPSPRAIVVGHEADETTGTLLGRVSDARNGTPVQGARVLVRGERAEAVTDEAGRFELVLPARAHQLSVIHAQYSTASRSGVRVVAEGQAEVAFELTPSAVELETLRVSGYRLEGGLASLMEERREQKAVAELLGAEQIQKSGDSTAAAALKRVTGLTVVDGKYVYVRGMGERYSSTLLNGAMLPSPEPERRVVPLNLFPADVIESIAVQKSYTPELPGEFGGGTVLLKTKGIPKEFFFKASAKAAYKPETTFEDGLTYRGGGADWLGYDDGTRGLNPFVQNAASKQPLVLQDPLTGEGYPQEVLEALGEVVPNIWSTKREEVDPDIGLNLAIGERFEPAGLPLGVRASVGYDNGYRILEGHSRALGVGGAGELTRIVDYRTESLTHTVDVSGHLSVGVEPAEGHQITASTLLVRTTDDETEVYQGYLQNDDAEIRVSRLNYVEQQLWSNQLQGEHDLFGAASLDWSYTYSLASRYQPDYRQTRYDFDEALSSYRLSDRPEGNQRLYADLEDQTHDLSAGLEVPFGVWDDLTATLALGGGYVLRERESEVRRFKFIHRGPLSRDPAILSQPAEQVFTPDTIGANGFLFEEITRNTDSYDAEQTIEAVYARLDLPLHADVDLSGGARLERSQQRVQTFDLFSRGSRPDAAELDRTDVLPAANLSWRFVSDMQLRLGYARTVVRPDFRELSLAPFDQVVGAGVFVGNPDLERTLIDSFDVRWEWYLSPDETVSLGLFYKLLHDPIETVILGGSNRTITLSNADEGRNVGVEFEFRKRLGFLGGFWEHVFVAGNVALIRSEVKLSTTGVATNDDRPLEGQSEYVLNLSCGYDDPESQTSLALLYNVSGERIVGIGTFGLPDVYEQPFHQLDLVASKTFAERWSVTFKAQNLLGEEVRLTQGGETVRSYEKGRTFSISVGVQF
ncbi:MAG: TonB-dependent receptor [Planctomycetota bacterium]